MLHLLSSPALKVAFLRSCVRAFVVWSTPLLVLTHPLRIPIYTSGYLGPALGFQSMTVLSERRTLRSSSRATSVVGLKMSSPNEGDKGVEKKTKVGRKKVVPVANDPLPDVKVTKKRGTKSAALNDEKKVEAAAAAKPAQRGRKNKTPPVEEEAEEVVVIAEGGAAEGEITRPRKRVAKEKKEEPVAEAKAEKAKPKGKGKGKGKGKAEKTLEGLQPEKERRLHADGYDWVYGVDEAGRGPLAGPVVTACCYVPPELDIPGIMDSKQMDEEAREAAFALLTSTKGVLYAISVVDNRRIDEINILQATLQGMRECVEECVAKHKPKDKIYALVDGNRDPKLCVPAELMIKGDTRIRCIAAASILAKVTRDRLMLEIDAQYPQYGFAQHKGYPTPAHKMALYNHGPCPLHRMTFKPIRKD